LRGFLSNCSIRWLGTLSFLFQFSKLWLENLVLEGINPFGDQGQPEMLRAFEKPLISSRAVCGKKLNVSQRVCATYEREYDTSSVGTALTRDRNAWVGRSRGKVVPEKVPRSGKTPAVLHKGELSALEELPPARDINRRFTGASGKKQDGYD
jgi:hypothetical protein